MKGIKLWQEWCSDGKDHCAELLHSVKHGLQHGDI